MKVLILEDDLTMVAGYRLLLKAQGFEVVGVASRALKGFELASSLQPDVMLVDVGLKRGESGIIAAGAVRKLFGTPFIVATAHADKEDEAISAGAGAFLIKGWSNQGNEDMLGETISGVVRRDREVHQAANEIRLALNGRGEILRSTRLATLFGLTANAPLAKELVSQFVECENIHSLVTGEISLLWPFPEGKDLAVDFVFERIYVDTDSTLGWVLRLNELPPNWRFLNSTRVNLIKKSAAEMLSEQESRQLRDLQDLAGAIAKNSAQDLYNRNATLLADAGIDIDELFIALGIHRVEG
jgi:DNA-binding NarL/FixJ family response regulator